MEEVEYLDEYKDLVLPGIKGDVRPSAGGRRRRISSDSSNSSSLDADIFQKLFLDKSVDDDLLNLNEGAGSKSHSRRHLSPSSSDESNDALDALFNRKLGKPKPNKRRERYSSFDSVDDLGQALMRSTQRPTVPKPSTSHARAKKSHIDAMYRSRSSSNSSVRAKSSSSKPKPAASVLSGKGAAPAAPSLSGKYRNPDKPNSVNGSSSAGKNKAVTILKAQKTDLKPPKHEPKTDPLNLQEFFEDSDSDSSYTYESDFFGDHDSAEDEDAEPVIDISTDTSRTTSVAAAAKRKQHAQMKIALQKRQDLIRNARRRRQQEEEERPALKRTKTDAVPSKDSERPKHVSMIGNDTIMTSPPKEARGEQPQTSQAAKRAAAAVVRGPHYAEITKHIIIPAPAKKPLDEKPTGSAFKKPMVQTLLSSTLNLRKPLPGESSSARKSLTKAEVEASKGQPSLNSSLVLTKKALLPPSKKIESPAKEDAPKASATAPRKVNISVSVVPSKDTVAGNSTLTKSQEKSPVLARKVQLVEAQKVARKSDVKKKVEPKEAVPEIPTAAPLDKSKPKVLPKSVVASDNPSKKTDSPAVSARKSLQAEAAKKAEARKSEGQALNSRKAPSKMELTKKIEARKSEGAASSGLSARKPLVPPQRSAAKEAEPQRSEEATRAPPKFDVSKKVEARKSEGAASSALNARKAPQPPQRSVAKETEPQKSEEATKPVKSSVSGAPEEVLAVSKARETAKKAITEQRKETAATARMEKPTVAVTPRTVSLAKTMHMTRAASSSRSLAPTPIPVSEIQRNASKESLPPPSGPSEAPQEPQSSGRGRKAPKGRGGRFKRVPAAQKRKALGAAEASDPKRLREEQVEPAAAFPVKITAADLDPQASGSKAQSNVPKPPVQEVKQRKLRIKINRRVVSQWLKENRAKRQAPPPPRKLPPPSDDLASDTESAAESMSESMNSSRPEPRAVLLPPVPPLAPLTVPTMPPTLAATAPPPVSVPPAPVPVPLPALIPAPVLAPLVADPDEARLLEEARKLAALRRVQMNPTLPMPLPVPIPVADVKSEPEDAPPEPMDGDFQEALAQLEAPPPPARQAPQAEGTPPVVISVMSTPGDRRASNEIPSASAPGASSANSFGHTKMFSFLYPNRHSGKYGEVGLDFCCPNLDGPMAAIDPTRLHAKVEAPVLEMPQYLVITTKFISKADKNIPNKVRAKLELLGKDKELSSPAPAPALASTASPAPAPRPQRKSSAPLAQPIIPPAAAPPALPAAPAASIDSLTKQLPRGTTLTKKVLPPGAAVPPTASDSMVASQPLSLIQLPTLCPGDQQRTELQTRVQVFDLVLQALSRRAATLTVAERQRTIEEIVRTSTLMPIDLDVGTKMLENYVYYLNQATAPKPPVAPEVRAKAVIPPAPTPVVAKVAVPPIVAASSPAVSQNIVSAATPPQDPLVTKKPVYDSHKNIIGYKCSSAPSVKPVVSTPRRKAAPVPAATSTPLASAAASTSSAAAADSRFLELDRATVEANQRKFIDLQTAIPLKPPGPKSSGKGTVIAIKTGPKTKTVVPPVPGKAASPAARVSATRGPAARGPPPLKPIAPLPAPTRSDSSGTIAAPSLSRTSNPNVFIINQASHVEESILPDSNNVEAPPLAAEIKGELEDSAEAII